MQYLVLIHSNAATAALFAGMTDEQRRAAFQVYFEVEADLEASGELAGSKALDEREQRIVTRTGGETVVTAAPPPETTEVVSGYYLVDVADEARAVEIAARFPEAAVGAVRVARVWTQADFDALGG